MRYKSNDDLVAALVRRGTVSTDAVRVAMERVDRASYLPPGSTAEAYADAPVVLKVGASGRASSTISQPTMVALMLEQLDVRPGDRVLEVGTASGYNAALLAHLAGPAGVIVTIEVDVDLARRAADRLAGLRQVHVIAGDGRAGHPDLALYDRIIVTAGSSAVESAWVDQLQPGGRLVLPITGADGSGRCVTFRRTADGLEEVFSVPCGFVPLR